MGPETQIESGLGAVFTYLNHYSFTAMENIPQGNQLCPTAVLSVILRLRYEIAAVPGL